MLDQEDSLLFKLEQDLKYHDDILWEARLQEVIFEEENKY